MTKAEKAKMKNLLDEKVKSYHDFKSRDDFPDKPCVRRAVCTLQNTVFNLAEVLWHCEIISWEECCEYWSKVDLTEGNEDCQFTNCGANIDGVCKYTAVGGVSDE